MVKGTGGGWARGGPYRGFPQAPAEQGYPHPASGEQCGSMYIRRHGGGQGGDDEVASGGGGVRPATARQVRLYYNLSLPQEIKLAE